MKQIRLISILLLTGIIFSCERGSYSPVCLHPENPHYFLFREKPAILIGSTEHYGAVMNLDFDYHKYLDELAASSLNVTRTFSGIYVEPQGAFGIEKNTLAPNRERFICPWSRSKEPGYANGGNKFDLNKWDDSYFERLRDFIREAGKRNIVVELDLFSNFYDTIQWKLSPIYIGNNINNIGNTLNHKEILALTHPEILDIQEKMVRKIITELRDFDNLYYEVCNEPYFGDTLALEAWEKKMTDIIIDAERNFNKKHLISQNIANGYRLVENPHPGVSIFNFHYAKPPETVYINYHLNKAIGDNETGFNGIQDATYRTEAWDFILAGGGLFNHLDYSFRAGNEDGTAIIKKGQPGGGGKTLRNQLHLLSEFMQELDYIHMIPDTGFLRIVKPVSSRVNALAKRNEIYVVYINNYEEQVEQAADQEPLTEAEIEVDLPAGSYELMWFDTKTGAKNSSKLNNHPGGLIRLHSPGFIQDIALKFSALN